MPYIHLEKTWEDYDKMIQLMISLSNDTFCASQDIYIYPDELISYGKGLQIFPEDLNHKVSLEYGSNSKKVHSHFILRTYIYNKAGHFKLEVLTNNNLEPPEQASSHFFIPCEASYINKFGRLLCDWVENMEQPLRYEW